MQYSFVSSNDFNTLLQYKANVGALTNDWLLVVHVISSTRAVPLQVMISVSTEKFADS